MSDRYTVRDRQVYAPDGSLWTWGFARVDALNIAKALNERDAEIARLRKRLGNILDHYEQLPGDIKSDSGFANLRRVLDISYDEEVRGE